MSKRINQSILERYPQLKTLKGLVPDEVVEREVGSRADEFEREISSARQTMPKEVKNGRTN